MPTLAHFQNLICPKCKGGMALLENYMLSFDLASMEPPHEHLPQDLGMFVKMCRNCGYSEFYSQMIIDEIKKGASSEVKTKYDPDNAPF